MRHTPTPWRVGDTDATTSIEVYIEDRPTIAEVCIAPADQYRNPIEHSEAVANAEFIVRAVNAHDDLVAALADERRWREAITKVLRANHKDGGRAMIMKHIDSDDWSPEEWDGLNERVPKQTAAAFVKAVGRPYQGKRSAPLVDHHGCADYEVVIDGHEFPNEESNLSADGEHPWFAVFSPFHQDNMAWGFLTRNDATEWARANGYRVIE